MSDINSLYDRIASGLATPALPDETAVALLAVARQALEDDEGDWDSALRVAVSLQGWRAANILRDAVRAGPFERSALALEWAPYAARDGVAALCMGLECSDEMLVLQALSLLSAHQVPAGTSRARRLLDHESAALRGAAATYLGLVAGPAVWGDLKALLGDEQVGAAARQAIERIDGDAERPEPAAWPDLEARGEAYAEPAVEAPPEELPPEPEALLVLLARVAPADQPALVESLQAASPALLAAAIRPLVATSPEDLAVGGCRYARLSAEPRWRLSLRRLLSHGAPRVRREAALALSVVGAEPDRSGLERAAQDPSSQVCEAAAAALQQIEARAAQA